MSRLSRRISAMLYDRLMAPAEKAGLRDWRKRLLENATGDVLEVGPGTGANLPLYPADIRSYIGLEPNEFSIEILAERDYAHDAQIQVLRGYAEAIPLEKESVDTVVSTLVLCSVQDVELALAEISRVLRPGGTLIFLEHVASEDDRVRRWQDRVDPFWHALTGDCHMNRRTEAFIRASGLQVELFERDTMPVAPALLNPCVLGIARKDRRL